MKEKILPFIKKYPMSILLAIIALNLFSIAGSLRENASSLRENAKRNKIELLCSVVNSIEVLPDEKYPNTKASRQVEVFDKIELLVGYDLNYGVDVGDVCGRLKQY